MFRYEQMWEIHADLQGVVAEQWVATGSVGTAKELGAKLEAFSKKLSSWDRRTFGHVKAEIRNLKREAEILQSVPGRVSPSLREIKINERLLELYYREKIMQKQISRVDWLTAGD